LNERDKNPCYSYIEKIRGSSNRGFTTFFPAADNFPIRISRRETLNDHRRDNGIGAYRSCIILLLLITVLTPVAAAADTMFRSNAEHTGVYNNDGIVPTNSDLWWFKTGGIIQSSPAVSNGVVYVGSNDNNIYAIDATTGIEKWRFVTGGTMHSSPAVSNGVVNIGSNDKNLYAIDAVRGVSTTPITTPTAVSTPGILSTPTPLLPSNSRNFNASQLYWIVFIILLIGILYEGWKAVTH